MLITAPSNPDLISYHHSFLQSILYQLEEVHDAWIGRDAWFKDDVMTVGGIMRWGVLEQSKAFKYLPQSIHEPDPAYVARLRASVFERKFRNAIERDYASLLSIYDLVGLHPSIQASLNNIDLRGNSLQSFVRSLVAHSLRDGMAGAWVDYPAFDGSDRTRFDFLTAERRPYLQMYPRRRLINWRNVYSSSGQRILAELVASDFIEEKLGTYGIKNEPIYKHFKLAVVVDENGKEVVQCPYRFVRIKEEGGKSSEETFAQGVIFLPEIPLVPLALSTEDPFVASLPLLDLCRQNFRLYSKTASVDSYIDKCCAPTLNVNELNPTGQQPMPRDWVVGINTVIENAEVKWIELTGNAIPMAKDDIKDVREEIDRLTLAFLSGQSESPTATQVRLDAAQIEASIQGMATELESSMQSVFRLWATYVEGVPTDGGQLKVNQRILSLPKEGTSAEILDAIAANTFSKEFGVMLLKARGYFDGLPDDEVEREMRRIVLMPSAAPAVATLPAMPTPSDDDSTDDEEDDSEDDDLEDAA